MNLSSLNVKIPLERVGVLIGFEGKVKEYITLKLNTEIEVDSKTGDVNITYLGTDPSLIFRARDVVLAIGRGFSPEKAFRLFNDELILYIIDLREIFGTASQIQRVKSRLIGKNGKTRRIFEEETMTSISIYGNTISIIGDIEHLEVAREAVNMLLNGALHRSVYRYLNKKRNELKKVEMEIWKSKPDLLRKEREKSV